MQRTTPYILLIIVLLSTSCAGELAVDDTPSPEDVPEPSTSSEPCIECVDDMLESAELEPIESPGLRRLTTHEYDNTIADLLGEDVRPAAALSEPTGSTYGNAAELQSPSSTLVAAAETLALQTAESVLADPTEAAPLLGCTPQGPDDRICFETFVRGFGQRALRRPLHAEEVDLLMAYADRSEAMGDFLYGARLVMRHLLQHAEFLYRVEAGTPVEAHPGLFALSGFEIASRMAYLIWGSAPDQALLDAAERGELSTPEGRRQHATRMLEDERALQRLQHFHSLWLGYQNSQLGDIQWDARMESDALIERVIFDERRPWLQILTFDETFLTPSLAEHYEMAPVEEPSWVAYTDGRAGILSHASFLNTGTKVGISSPTMRGLHVFERLFCGHVDPPPPTLDIDDAQISKCGADGFCERPSAAAGMACSTDDDCPEELGCKSEYSAFYLGAHAEGEEAEEADGKGCASCHRQMDPIGLGLEGFDAYGRPRTHEEPKPLEGSGFDQPNCVVDGQGTAPGLGEFSGPGELGDLLASSRAIEVCGIRQWQQFAWGLSDLPAESHPAITGVHQLFERNEGDLVATIVDVVADESFALRREIPRAEEREEDAPELAEPPTPETELMDGVDLGILSIATPTIDANCSEYAGLATVEFEANLVDNYNNTGQSCRFAWNGSPDSPRLYGCCEVSDADIEAVLAASDQGNIWDDDGIAFVVAPPVREKSDQMIKTEINVNGAVQESRWPDGPQPYDGNVERAADVRIDGYTIEFASDFPHTLQVDPRAHCEFRINDRDAGQNGWALALGERLLRESTWGMCQFVP